jgi:hypothetical protein
MENASLRLVVDASLQSNYKSSVRDLLFVSDLYAFEPHDYFVELIGIVVLEAV